MSQRKKSNEILTKKRKEESEIIDNHLGTENMENRSGKEESKIIDNHLGIENIENRNQTTRETENIENIFATENPTIKDVLIILREIYSSQQFISVTKKKKKSRRNTGTKAKYEKT